MDSFISFGYTMAILIFGFVIYLVLSMPTKRDLRKAMRPDAEARRSVGLAAELRARKGARCRLLLGEVHFVANSSQIEGVVEDVDDEWVLVRTMGSGQGARLVAVRLEGIAGIEE